LVRVIGLMRVVWLQMVRRVVWLLMQVEQARMQLDEMRAKREQLDRAIASQRLANEKAKTESKKSMFSFGGVPGVGGGGQGQGAQPEYGTGPEEAYSSARGAALSHVILGKETGDDEVYGEGRREDGIHQPPQPASAPRQVQGPGLSQGNKTDSGESWGLGGLNLGALPIEGLKLSGESQEQGGGEPQSCKQQ
jgi:hypothetical protein